MADHGHGRRPQDEEAIARIMAKRIETVKKVVAAFKTTVKELKSVGMSDEDATSMARELLELSHGGH